MLITILIFQMLHPGKHNQTIRSIITSYVLVPQLYHTIYIFPSYNISIPHLAFQPRTSNFYIPWTKLKILNNVDSKINRYGIKFKFRFFIGITKHDKGLTNHNTKDTEKNNTQWNT